MDYEVGVCQFAKINASVFYEKSPPGYHISGHCHDAIDSYWCECAHGWESDHCEVNTDECLSSPCAHYGSCIDEIADFKCNCCMEFDGRQCEYGTFTLFILVKLSIVLLELLTLNWNNYLSSLAVQNINEYSIFKAFLPNAT